MDAYAIAVATNRPREVSRVAGGWAGAVAGAKILGAGGVIVGSIEPGPGNAIGGIVGGIAGGVLGYWGGEEAALSVYDYFAN